MSVYLRGRTWWIQIHEGGRTVRRSARTTSKREALALEKRIRQQGRVGYGHTYLDALKLWLPTAPASALSAARNTHELYPITLDRLPAAANRMASQMVADGLSPLTVNRRLAVVRRVLNLAYRQWDLIDQPLAQKIRQFSEKGTERDLYLSVAEVDALLAAIEHPEVRAYLEVLVYTGLRKMELYRMTPDRWQPPYLHLTAKTKSKRPRAVPVIARLHASVRLPWSFTEHDLRRNFEAARAAIDQPTLRLHDLRHTYASWLASDPDIPMTLVRDLLGHSTIAVTSRYAHLRPDTAAAIERAIGTKQTQCPTAIDDKQTA